MKVYIVNSISIVNNVSIVKSYKIESNVSTFEIATGDRKAGDAYIYVTV
jgi:hypothetical protein